MRIGLIRRSHSPSGGAETYLARFAQGLADAGHEPVLLSGPDWPPGAWPHAGHHVVPATSPLAFSQALTETLPGLPLDLTFSLERVETCDVYRAGDGLHRAWMKRIELHSRPLENWWRRRRRLHRETLRLEESVFSNPERLFIANSQMVRKEILSCFKAPPGKVLVIPNGYDAPAPQPGARENARREIRIRHHLPTDAALVLFAGSGWKRKGAAIAAQAVANLPDRQNTHLFLIGRGRLPHALASHKRLHPIDPVPQLTRYYLAADLFVLPTLYDPFSNACLEAAAHGVPVLTTTENGFREVLQEFRAAGEVLPPGREPKAWSNLISTWLEPARHEAAQPDLARIREQFTMTRNVKDTIKAVETHLARKSPEG